jgi:hypothetical protein
MIRAIKASVPASTLDTVGIATEIDRLKAVYVCRANRTGKSARFDALRAVPATQCAKQDFPLFVF